jgi:hypothetical protein
VVVLLGSLVVVVVAVGVVVLLGSLVVVAVVLQCRLLL